MISEQECRKLQAELRQLLNTEDVDISVEDQCVVLPLAPVQQLVINIRERNFA